MGLLPTKGGLGSKSDAEQSQCALLNHGWLGEHIEGGGVFVDGLNFVFDDCCQIAEKRLRKLWTLVPSAVCLVRALRLAEVDTAGGATMEAQAASSLRLIIIVEKDGAKL